MEDVRFSFQNVIRYLSKHREFFLIFAGVLAVVSITRLDRNEMPGSDLTIQIDQLPRIYFIDTTKLKAEVFYLKSSAEKKMPKSIVVKFHQFNFHVPTNRWYLSKYDLQSLLPDFTIIRIEPDTIWFSPWHSEVKYLPVRLQVDVPQPFELVNMTIEPDTVPILSRGTNSYNDTFINLGKIRAKKDYRFQEFAFKAKEYLPYGTATSIQDIKVRVEIGQWKPNFVVINYKTSTKSYNALVYIEIPVDDSTKNIHHCIQIHSQNKPPRFSASVADSLKCSRIRRIKLLSINEIET